MDNDQKKTQSNPTPGDDKNEDLGGKGSEDNQNKSADDDGQSDKGGDDAFTPEQQKKIDKLLQERLDRERKKTEKEVEARVKKEREEAERLATLTAEEKQKEELAIQERANADKERQLNIDRNVFEGTKKLMTEGFEADSAEKLVRMIATEDADDTSGTIDSFLTEFRSAVSKGIQKEVAGNTPTEPGDKGDSKEKKKGSLTF